HSVIESRMVTILFLTAIVQWAYNGIWFLPTLFRYFKRAFTNHFGNGVSESSISGPIIFGTLSPKPEIISTIVYPPYLYYLLLAAIVTLSVGWIYTADIEYDTAWPVLIVGILASLLIFPTPVSIMSPNRIRLPWIPLFAVVIGVAVAVLLRSDSGHRYTQNASIIIVALLLTAAPLAVSDVTLLGPQKSQQAYSPGEYQQLSEASDFADMTPEQFSAFWQGRITAERFGTDVTSVKQINRTTIRIHKGLFLYRSAWSRYLVPANTEFGFIPLAFSKGALNQIQTTQSVVYDGGKVELIYAPTNTTIIHSEK
ncbi:MAG: hypothetical protein ABEI86_07235, partial [Halobacteriaceae archaeon]